MSFFGGGTDFSEFFKEYGGSVLSTTFDKYCYVTVRHLPRFFEYTSEICYSQIERVNFISEVQHPMIREAMRELDIHEIRLTYEADLPKHSGLGTSSSFAVGMLNAFHLIKGQYRDCLLYTSHENEIVGSRLGGEKAFQRFPAIYGAVGFYIPHM